MTPGLALVLASVLIPPGAPSTAPAGTALGDAIAAVESAQLAPRALSATGKTFQLGHLTLRLESGELDPVVGADGTALGFYFQGKGTYRYVVEDARERYVFLRNLKRLAPNLIPTEDRLEDRFERALVLSTDALLPREEIADGAAPSRGALQAFAEMGKRLQRTDLPFEHLLGEARTSGDAFQYAEIEGAFATLGFRVDRLRTFDEVVATYRNVSGVEPRLSEVLAFQDTQDPRDRPTLHLRRVELALRSSDRRSASVTARLEVEPAFPGQRILRFRLQNQRDPRERLWTSPENALHVRGVTDAGGRALPFSHRQDELLVELPEPAPAEGTLVLRVDYDGEFLTTLNRERGDQYVELCSFPWFPQPTGPDAPPFTYTLSVSMPKPFLPVASGTTTAFRETAEGFELESRGTAPARWIGVVAGRFRVQERVEAGVRYRVHAYATQTRATQERLLGLAVAAVREMGARLGPPPFDELDVVELPSLRRGMAPAGLVLVSAAHETGLNHTLFAHALARQWLHNSPATRGDPDTWLEAAVVNYVTGEVSAALEPPDKVLPLWKTCLAEWRGFAKECAEAAPLSRTNALGGELGERERQCLLASRGPLVLHMLRSMVGDAGFRQVVRALTAGATEHALRQTDLERAIGSATTSDLSWYAGQWGDQWDIPDVRARWSVESGSSSPQLQLSVTQARFPVFRLVLPVVVDYPGNRRELHLVVQESRDQEFRLRLSGSPIKVSIDPANNNLAVYK